IAVACFFTYLAHSLHADTFVAKELIIVSVLSVFIFFQEFYRLTPIRRALARIETIQERLPHERKLDLIYQKDEFELIEEMLSMTEQHLKDQKETFENQSIQSDTVLKFIPNALIIIDKYKNCKLYNQQFALTFIKNKNIQMVESEKLWKVFNQEELLAAFDKALTGERINLNAKHFPDTNEFFDIKITPVKNIQNEITGALGIFHNVTVSKLNEKMRVDFVANVSHEVRTPLTSIKGYTQLLQAHKDKIPAQFSPVLEKINANTERLKDLFDNLLKLSVIESKYEIDKEDFDLSGLIEKVKTELKGKYLNKNFQVNVSSGHRLCGDKKMLEQVFINLIDNAIKYSNKESAVIDIDSNETDTSFEVTVKDNGPGLEASEHNRIFERFYRVQGRSEKLIEGTGLGLSIVKHIIQKHQGSIKASSEEGIGSTFTISLPKLDQC
ncbi:MAG: GHKL domain-containing protein, partial [Bacteriovoracaceae bacterium]|nr:GHKL domain-containing protein [Bacteriovoracaceae bacterium]